MRRRRGGSSTSPPAFEARWIDRQADFEEIVAELREQPVFAVDTEFHRERTYFPKLALIQIEWADRRVLVDPLAVDVEPFADALRSPATVVMHAASQDLEVLALACDALPTDLFDTQVASAFLNPGMPGLTALVERFFDVRIPKGDRLTDWLQRPLGSSQRSYAAADVAYLLRLHGELRRQLVDEGRLDWAAEEFRLLLERGRAERDPSEAWLRIKEARSLRGEAAGVARTVAAWRERRAADVDRPVRHVLSDLAVVGIAQRRPRTPKELEGIRGFDARQVRGPTADALLEAVASGRDAPPPRQPRDGAALDRRLRPAVALVSAWVGQLARDLSMETSVLATRSDIEGLLAEDAGTRLADGWRAELVGEPVRRLVAGESALAFDGAGRLLMEDRGTDPVPPAVPG